MNPTSAGTPPLVQVFKTDLFLPRFPDGCQGEWEIRTVPLVLDHGYHTGTWLVENLQTLIRHREGRPETWMSLSPHEIESQELGCRHAFGHTVVMGLGLGWITLNLALNPAVTRVTVVEQDLAVMTLFKESRVLEQVPLGVREKVSIMAADALAWTPDQAVDFLYADIWLSLGEPGTLDQVRQMQGNVKAKQVYFWGQELWLHALAAQEREDDPVMDQACLDACAARMELPLLLPGDLDYGAMIRRIVGFRKTRGLPILRRP